MEPTRPEHEKPWRPPQHGHDGAAWTSREILEEARADARRTSTPSIPFVVQAGEALMMVEAGDDGWTLAMLEFDAEACAFGESWRATYTWPREAFGVMLSRLMASGLDESGVSQLTDEFSAWLGSRFSSRRCDGRVPC